MCRWLAYIGEPVQMDDLLLKPEHSMIDQSRHAKQSTYEINADGFGVGWYGEDGTPGVYHDIRPVWNDVNFRDIAAHIRSNLFLCHIRASSGAEVVRSNWKSNFDAGGLRRLRRGGPLPRGAAQAARLPRAGARPARRQRAPAQRLARDTAALQGRAPRA